jgi:hypothetical protein
LITKRSSSDYNFIAKFIIAVPQQAARALLIFAAMKLAP